MRVHKILGLMSGTSLDGLDLAYCHFWEEESGWKFNIHTAKTVPYEETLRSKLIDSINFGVEELLELDYKFGKFLGEEAASFIAEEKLEVDYIASHGHTVHHRPELGFTLQIGSGQQLAISSGHTVICDFRSKDIALGGQGAPLVPIGDQMFFDDYTYCLNLGGISNVSFKLDGKRIAYDIGIANMLLNYLSRKLGKDYDAAGSIAHSGNLDQQLLTQLNGLEYYQLAFPKSTGFEWFKEEIVPLIDTAPQNIPDLLNTGVHHIAEQVAKQLLMQTNHQNGTVFVTGGGAFNDYLMEVLRKKLSPQIEVVIPSPELISYKEAMVFAFMGISRILGKVNILSSVTGASSDSCSGTEYEP